MTYLGYVRIRSKKVARCNSGWNWVAKRLPRHTIEQILRIQKKVEAVRAEGRDLVAQARRERAGALAQWQRDAEKMVKGVLDWSQSRSAIAMRR